MSGLGQDVVLASAFSESRVTIIDTSVLLNVVASGVSHEILTTWGVVAIPPTVERETQSLRSEHDLTVRVPLSLDPLIASGALVRVTLTAPEQAASIALTQQLDDGEAEALAVGLKRQWSIATDDRKAIRVINKRVPVFGTLDLVKRWTEHGGVTHHTLRQVFNRIHVRARWEPARSLPLFDWWERIVR